MDEVIVKGKQVTKNGVIEMSELELVEIVGNNVSLEPLEVESIAEITSALYGRRVSIKKLDFVSYNKDTRTATFRDDADATIKVRSDSYNTTEIAEHLKGLDPVKSYDLVAIHVGLYNNNAQLKISRVDQVVESVLTPQEKIAIAKAEILEYDLQEYNMGTTVELPTTESLTESLDIDGLSVTWTYDPSDAVTAEGNWKDVGANSEITATATIDADGVQDTQVITITILYVAENAELNATITMVETFTKYIDDGKEISNHPSIGIDNEGAKDIA